MINESFVSYETAKLLKKAGFPQEGGYDCFFDKEDVRYSIPKQSQAMRWLREVHHINIRINWHSIRHKWFFDMLNIANIYDYFESEDYLPTYEAATEAGIQAACKYLIGKSQSQL